MKKIKTLIKEEVVYELLLYRHIICHAIINGTLRRTNTILNDTMD